MRIVVEGSNGAGKSTLINHLMKKYALISSTFNQRR